MALALLFTIALGIGSNASVHGFIRGLVDRDTPATALDRVVSIYARDGEGIAGPVSYDAFLALERHRDTFEWLGAARESQGNVVVADQTEILSVAVVTPHLAQLLDLSLGDGVVISRQLWETLFRAKANVRGDTIRIDGLDARVSGVAPDWLEGLYLGRAIDIWMPLRQESVRGGDRSSRSFWVLGRLRPNVSANRAENALYARGNASQQIGVLPYTGFTPEMADGFSHIRMLLGVAAAAVFLVACANVASFLLGRASTRSRETSVRVALGASRGQLAAQLLSDSVLISVAGGAFGVLLAVWTSDIVPALFFESDAEQLVLVPDIRSIGVASAVCVALTIAFGLLPLFEIRHDRPAAVLRRESAGPSKTMMRVRAGLVVAQMTFCCVLVISSGLLLQGFRAALRTSVGRRLGQPILVTVQAQSAGTLQETSENGLRYLEDVEREADSVVHASASAWAARLPGSRPVWQSLLVEPPPSAVRNVTLDVAGFTAESLELITLPPIAGRMFSGRDGPRGCRVAIVNEAAAKELFDGDAVGRSIEDPTGQQVEIIGVVSVRKTAHAGEQNRPTIYYYADQTRTPFDTVGPARFRVPTILKLGSATLDANIVSRSYFEGMGMSRVSGQIFPGDSKLYRCRVAVINKEAAEAYFAGNAVGGAVIDRAGRRTRIIGVVNAATLGTFQRRAEPAIYFPMAQDFLPRMTLILAAQKTSKATVDTLRGRLEGVAGGAPVPVLVTTLEAHLGRTALAPLRVATVLVRASAAMALTLGVLGLYGALTDAARQRRRELAVRIALGAPAWRVIGQVLGDAGRLAGAGALVGTLGSLLVAGPLARIAPSPGSGIVWAWLAGPLVLIAVVALASLLPARRALMVQPLTIMRGDN